MRGRSRPARNPRVRGSICLEAQGLKPHDEPDGTVDLQVSEVRSGGFDAFGGPLSKCAVRPRCDELWLRALTDRSLAAAAGGLSFHSAVMRVAQVAHSVVAAILERQLHDSALSAQQPQALGDKAVVPSLRRIDSVLEVDRAQRHEA